MGASPAHNISPSSVAQARSPVPLGPLFSLTVNGELSAGNFPRSLPPHSQIRVLLPTSSATSLQFPVACIPPRNPRPFFGVREPCPRFYGLTPTAIPSCLTFSAPSAASGSVLCLLPVPPHRFAFPRRQMTCTQLLPLPRHHFLDRRRQHRIAFHRRRPFHSRQLPQFRHVLPVVSRVIDRRLHQKRPAQQSFRRHRPETRMPQNPRERRRPDLPIPNMLVPVHSSAERHLRIIHMKHRYSLKSDRPINRQNRLRQPRFALDVIAGRKQMSRIQARPDMQTPQVVHQGPHFLEPRADRSTHTRRILNQNPHVPNRHTPRRLLYALHDRTDCLFHRRVAPRPRMHHHKIRAQRQRPYQLLMKRLDRPCPQHRLRRRQVHQVVRMNHQRPQPQLLPPCPERLSIRLRHPHRCRLPHPRARRKNLQRIRSQFPRRFQRVQITSRDRGVNPYPQTPIHPRRRLWFRFRPRHVFIVRLKFRIRNDWIFRHPCADSSAIYKLYILPHRPKPDLCRATAARRFVFAKLAVRSDRRPALLHSAHAIPSGSFPVSNVVVTSSFFKSTTATLLSPLTATNALESSGAIKIPSALFPSFSRFTSFRVPASITSNSPLPKSEISTHLPLGVNFTRFECLVPTFTVSVTFFVVVSIIVTVPSPEPAAHTSVPSGEMSIPSGPFPVGITVLNHFCLSGEATTAVTESEFTFDV